MSDNIPLEIQMEIIQRISDTKSVIRCRSVSKEWKSVIDSKEFVADHTFRHQDHKHHLLIKKRDVRDAKVNYVSIVDNDDTFPLQNVFLLLRKRDSSDGQVKFRQVSVSVPDSGTNTSCHRESFRQDEFIDDSTIVGTSHGLFCLYIDEAATAVIWNPSIRKTVVIRVPNLLGEKHYRTIIGFGVCPQNLDPKLVKITYDDDLRRLQDVNASIQVEVFSLSSGGTWRSLSGNLPNINIDFGYPQAVVGRFIYWDAVDTIYVDDEFRNPKLIMSFDLTSEELTKVNLPDCLALDRSARLSLRNLRESLAVLELKFNEDFSSTVICHVWQMIGHGCTRSFNKLYSIDAPNASIGTTEGFRKNGAPIIEVDNDKEDYNRHERALAIHDPE